MTKTVFFIIFNAMTFEDKGCHDSPEIFHYNICALLSAALSALHTIRVITFTLKKKKIVMTDIIRNTYFLMASEIRI